MNKLLRAVVGVVIGYAIMVLLITWVQEVWFGGVGWYRSSGPVLLGAGLFTCVSAAVGGMVATVVSAATGRLAAVLMTCLIVVETTTLVVTGRVAGPLWFDVVAAASLILSVLAGAELYLSLRRRGAPRPS